MKHTITPCYGLTAAQLQQIGHLAAQVDQFEGLTMKLNWNTLRQRPPDERNDFLCYAGEELTGYLGLFIFNNKEAEVSAMVAPAGRRQGVFTALLAAARGEARRRKVAELLFICERASKNGLAVMQQLGSSYQFSEYRMDLTKPVPPLSLPVGLTLRPARLDDIPVMAQLEQLCFQIPAAQAESRLREKIGSPAEKALVVTCQQAIIGKIHLLSGPEEIYISAFCMLPAYRGRGYGSAILSDVVTQLASEGQQTVTLEVETKNEQALQIYRRRGFEVKTVYDYFQLAVT